MNKTEKNWSPETPATCPVSGLPVTRRPAWNDIDLGKGYLVSFEFIGDRMLLSRSMGWKNASRQSIKQLFRERRKVLGQMLDRNEPFVELRDYSHFEGLSSKESRDQFIAEIAKDKDRVMAFIGFNAPKAVQIAFNVWSRLFHAPFPISIAKDYPAALKKALAAIGPTVQSLDRSGQKVVKFPQYTYSSGNFRVEFEIIENRIVHSNAKGIYTPKDVAPSTAYLGRVCAHVEKIWQRSYFINGVTELDVSSYKTRVKYLGKIKQWHTNFPNFNAIVFYGANRWIKAGIHLTKHLVPFKVKIVDDLESA
ncbi:MAG: hypothetical protein GY697_24500, partial [Desulfobacterales bacterium]|nr:hypothetical protein [Desulfobacterales bacterium]